MPVETPTDPINSSQLGDQTLEPSEIDVREYLDVFRRRWLLFALAFAVIFVLVFLQTLLTKKKYQSVATLVVSTQQPGSNSSGDGDILSSLTSLTQSRNVDTQVEIIKSRDYLDAAFARLPKSEQVAGFGERKGDEEIPAWSYEIKNTEQTDVILITTLAYTPKAAADFANAICENYLDADLQRNSKATRQARIYVQGAMKNTLNELNTWGGKLASYMKTSGVVNIDTQMSDEAKALADLQIASVDAQTAAQAASNKVSALRNQIQQLTPNIRMRTVTAENPEFAQVEGELLQDENNLVQATQEYAASAPEVTSLQNQIRTTEAQLKQMARTAVSSVQDDRNPVQISLLTIYGSAIGDEIAARIHAQSLKSEYAQQELKWEGRPDKMKALGMLEERVSVLRKTYDMLSDRYYSLLIEEQSSIPNGVLASAGRPSAKPALPKVGLGALLALAVGFVGAVLVTLGAEKLDSRVHRPEDVERITHLPVLTFVPEAKAPEGGRLFFGVAEPNHAFTESFRLLRNNVSFALPDTKLVTIAVTSAAISEGKSTVSVNLAIALAMDGKKVLLVDSDLRRPTIHKWMDISNEVGYTSVVVGTATLEEAVQPTQWEGLSALPSGPLPPGATEFLNSKKSHDTVAKIAELYDVVVLDAPPCTGLSDMQVISKLASGVIVVACLESTPKPLLVNTMRLLRQASAPLIGIVINRTKGTGKGKYGYYGYYGYYGSYGYYGYYGYEQEGSESEPRKKRKGTSKKS